MVEILSPLLDKQLPPFDRDIGRYASMARAIAVDCDGIVPGRLTPNRYANAMEVLGATPTQLPPGTKPGAGAGPPTGATNAQMTGIST